MSIILGLTGEKLSGKGTAAEYLVAKYKVKHYRFSAILDDIIKRLYLPITRENQIDIALALRNKFGNEILAHVLKKDIENDQNELCIIDGIRYWEEYHILKILKGFVLVYISSPLETRFNRTQHRAEKADEKNISLENFKRQELAPTEIIIKELAKQADYQIDNNGSLEEYQQKIDDVIKAIKK